MIAVAGEILPHFDGALAVLHYGDQVRRRDLGVDELTRGVQGAQLVGNRHGAQVEVKHQQAAIPVQDIAGLLGRHLGGSPHGGRRGRGRGSRGSRRLRPPLQPSQRRIVQLLEFEQPDGLRDLILGDDEILGFQPLHRLAALVGDRYRFHHQLRRSGEPRNGGPLRRRLRAGYRQCE